MRGKGLVGRLECADVAEQFSPLIPTSTLLCGVEFQGAGAFEV